MNTQERVLVAALRKIARIPIRSAIGGEACDPGIADEMQLDLAKGIAERAVERYLDLAEEEDGE